MLAKFAANKDHLITEGREPEESVHVDVRGVIQINENHCSISVGEIRSDRVLSI